MKRFAFVNKYEIKHLYRIIIGINIRVFNLNARMNKRNIIKMRIFTIYL